MKAPSAPDGARGAFALYGKSCFQLVSTACRVHSVCMPRTRTYGERFLDLPAWAREELKAAEEEIDRLLATVARLAGKEQTTVSVQREDAGGEMIRQFIPEGSGVDFDLPNGSRLNVMRDKNSLRVSERTDTSQILVVPQTTGVINIGVISQK